MKFTHGFVDVVRVTGAMPAARNPSEYHVESIAHTGIRRMLKVVVGTRFSFITGESTRTNVDKFIFLGRPSLFPCGFHAIFHLVQVM